MTKGNIYVVYNIYVTDTIDIIICILILESGSNLLCGPVPPPSVLFSNQVHYQIWPIGHRSPVSQQGPQ